MTTQITQAQSDSLGGAAPCTPAGAQPIKGDTGAAPAVLVADPTKAGWVTIELKTPAGAPVPGERFSVETSDGRIVAGKLDPNGKIRVEGVEPGTCQVRFPDRDAKEWHKK